MKQFCLNILKVVAALIVAVLLVLILVGGVASLILSAFGKTFQLEWIVFLDYLIRGVGFGSGLVIMAAAALGIVQWAWPKPVEATEVVDEQAG